MNYIDLYNNEKEKLNSLSNNIINKARENAFKVVEQGFPNKKDEKYKYTDVNNIFSNFQLDGNATKTTTIKSSYLDAHKIVINNGELISIELSGEKGLTAKNINQAPDNVLKKHYNKYVDIDYDAAAALNTLFATNGLYIHIEKNTTLKKPILIVSNNSAENTLFQLRNLFVFEENSEATVILDNQGNGSYLSNHLTEVYVGESARINIVRVQEEENSTLFTSDYVQQESKSLFNYFTLMLEGKLIRNSGHVHLAGEHCENHLYGVVIGKENQHLDNYTFIDHAVPNCESNEHYKSVLTDKAVNVFNGRILVREDAQKTLAFQANNNILLSDDAKMYTKPQLEIYADDVRCSHGATIGQLSSDELFYMQARGISKETAKVMLTTGFLSEVVYKVDNAIQNYLIKKIESKIHKLL